MKISCPSCSAKYSIADEKVQDRLAKIRCRKCGTTIVIDGKVAPPNVYAADHASASSSPDPAAAAATGGGDDFSVDLGAEQPNMSLDQLIAAYNSGDVTAETYVWREGMADWQPLGEVPEIVDALNVAAGAPPSAPSGPSGPSAPGGDSPWGSEPQAALPSEPPRAAARSGGRAAASDLFGGFDAAGSEEDVMTSAPGGGGAAPALGEPSPPAGGQPTGARNESSVLFSLSALTSARDGGSSPSPSSPSAPGPSAPTGGLGGMAAAAKEDSGLIDLKALTAEAKPADTGGGGVAGMVGGGIAAPLGMAAPLGGTAAEAIEAPGSSPQQKSKTGLYIGGGIAVAAVAIAAMVIFKPSDATPPVGAVQPTAATAAPAPTEKPEEEKKPEDEVTAKPPSTGTADEEEKPPEAEAKKPASTPRPAVAAVRRPAPGPKPAATPAPKPKPAAPAPKPTSTKKKKKKKKGSSSCKCPPGDLMCAMKCAASRK